MERAVRDVAREFQGQNLTISAVDGWHCPACGEVEFADGVEASRFFAAAQAAQDETMRRQAQAIRAIRSRLGLTQKQAAELLGGGVNAFSEYERGITRPSKSTLLLLKLLDRHPELVQEARQL
jgi:HTH-type transcriptional regulator/antitoxin MqsA